MRLSWTVFLSIVSIAVATSHVSSYDERKYGCLVAPEICTPPENCDGLTGNCQVPYRKNHWNHGDTPSKLVKAIRDLELLGYDVDQDDVAGVLLARQEFDFDDDQYASMSDSARLHRLVAAITGPDTSQEFRRSVPVAAFENGQGILVHRETENPGRETLMTADNERLQHMKRLVDEAKQALAQKGKTFSDLTPDEVQSLASFLAKLLVKNNEEQEKIQKSINDNFDQDSFEENTGRANSDESADKKGVAEDKEQRANIEELLEEPINEEVRGFNNDDIENPKTSDPASSDLPKQQTSKVNKSSSTKNSTLYVVIIVVGSTVLLIILVTIISCIVYTYRIKKDENKKFIGQVAGNDAEPFGDDYQELCRQHYASKNSELNDNHKEIIDDGSTAQDPLITRTYPLTKPTGSGPEAKHIDTASLSSHANATRNSSVSSVSWSEEPVTANLDITTGHAVLSYMEDHLNNKDRLDKEWEEICGYEADSITTAAAITPQNSRKNRSVVALPYDHNRIKLNPQKNHLQSDYINASAIIDNDPKRPLYIAAQGPLPSTIPDFWQMMWEQGCVAIVMLTPLVEEGVNQCARYWPDEGSCTYHDFEIHLVSEHIWCEDYLVRSLYLKHLGTGETRTVTQFHFLSWPKDRVPSTPKPLLELRRKVTKCYKGHNSPVLVHCSDGVGRTGTYILLDLAIDRMLKGAKEIDIAATLEHIRDQRVGMVAKKEQFEFALTAVAEEVNAILKTLLH